MSEVDATIWHGKMFKQLTTSRVTAVRRHKKLSGAMVHKQIQVLYENGQTTPWIPVQVPYEMVDDQSWLMEAGLAVLNTEEPAGVHSFIEVTVRDPE